MYFIRILMVFYWIFKSISDVLAWDIMPNNNSLNVFVKNQLFDSEGSTIIGLIPGNGSQAIEIVDLILTSKHFKRPYSIIMDIFEENCFNYPKEKFTDAIFVLENMEAMQTFIRDFRTDIWIWTWNIFFIIIESATRSVLNLETVLHKLWTECDLINYTVVILNDLWNIELVTYNPFIKRIKRFTVESTRDVIFTNKIENLQGYQLKVGLFKVHPVEKVGNTSCHGSLGCVVMDVLLKQLNATVKFINPPKLRDTFRQIKERQVDLTFNELFVIDPAFLHHCPYPLKIMEIVALVKKSKELPLFLRVFFIFDIMVWSLLSSLAIIGILIKYVIKYKINFKRQSIGGKIFLASFLFCFFFFSNTFHGGIIGAIVAPKYYNNLDTVSDLVRSGLPLYTEPNWKSFINGKLLNQTVNSSYVTIARDLRYLENNRIYAVTGDYAETFLNNKKYPRMREEYHELKDKIGSALLTLFAKARSPFKESIKNIQLSLVSRGIHNTFGKAPIKFVPPKKQVVTLTLLHLEMPFLLLLVGHTVSFCVFMLEIIWKKFGKTSNL
ncbi:hypothetical protein GWI33_006463 [Rhynchophorus ferrugineus]|uniref:Ionotropic receptor n=1 Tax=Rhynchophorus ferrugineus TaxID=354439 RepID=A0A834MD02_RHYFE|nr:hypothetical protein GWI33_006463 [Rhynchophorus ferrugineus]